MQQKRQSPMQRMLLQQRSRSGSNAPMSPVPYAPPPVPEAPVRPAPSPPPLAPVTTPSRDARPHTSSPQQQALLRMLSKGELKRGTSAQSLPPPKPPPPTNLPPHNSLVSSSSYPLAPSTAAPRERRTSTSALPPRQVLSPAVALYRPPTPEYGTWRRPKRALLVGIAYRGHRHLPPLEGSRNDVENMFNLLLRVGFQRENIRVLCDVAEVIQGVRTERPTSVNILRGLSWVGAGLRGDEGAVFYFAGHGDFVPDVSGDEESGFDQCILPVDYEPRPAHDGADRVWRGAAAILDDTIYERLVRAVPVGAKVTAIVDACRSGSVCDLPIVYDAVGAGAPRFAGAAAPRQVGRFAHLGAGAFALFSGSADHEMSAEMAVVDEGGEVRNVGIMTSSFIEAVDEAVRRHRAGEPPVSYGHVLNTVRLTVRERAATVLPLGMEPQEPQLSTSHAIDLTTTPFAL